jgi:hypothetical protein
MSFFIASRAKAVFIGGLCVTLNLSERRLEIGSTPNQPELFDR